MTFPQTSGKSRIDFWSGGWNDGGVVDEIFFGVRVQLNHCSVDISLKSMKFAGQIYWGFAGVFWDAVIFRDLSCGVFDASS